VLVRQSTNFFAIRGKKFSGFKPLEEEINHFRHIKVTLEEIGGLERRIRQVIASVQAVQEAKAQYAAGQLSLDDLLAESARQNQGETFFAENTLLEIRRVANHYYIPVLLSENERIDYIRTVIHVASEVHFMRQLEDYVRQKDNGFRAYDWWLFSRVEEKLDDITIPYYYPVENRMANFKPDFIFWLRKGNRYKILFVDPKGTGRSEYEHKVDGYRLLFEENGQPKIFHHQGLDVSVHLFLYTADRQLLADGYRRFWYDDVGKMMEAVG